MKHSEVPPELQEQVEQAFVDIDRPENGSFVVVKEVQKVWPFWLKFLLVLSALAFVAGVADLRQLWPEPQTELENELRSELDSEREVSSQLREQLDAAPTEVQLRALELRHDDEIRELNFGWAGRMDSLRSQHTQEMNALQEQHMLELQAEQTRTEEAQRLQEEAEAGLTAELNQIPSALAEMVSAATVEVRARHYVGVAWNIERTWVWEPSWMPNVLTDADDETHVYENPDGVAFYQMRDTPITAFWEDDDYELIRMTVGMPELDHSYFVEKSVEEDYGWLADQGHVVGEETDQQPLLDEANRRLRDKACADVESLRAFVDKTQAMVTAGARGHDVLLRWRDANGLYHDHADVTDQMLLDNACTG